MHIPVLQKEVLQYLDPKPNENFIDATIDGGGHTITILGKIKPNGKVLGIEIDPEIYQKLESKNLDRLVLTNDSYVNLKSILEKSNFRPVNGILFDLGMSSWHLEESGRGFTFLKDEPLDMRYSLENNLTAEKIINNYSQEEIEKILKEYGEERFARRIAKRIIKERPIKTTLQLVEIIKRVVPGRTKINPATRTFQALRIAVNDELNNLRKVLPQTIEVLAPGGKIVIISFHSLEDRIVKNFFKSSNLNILTKKPVRPSKEEIKINPRSRSAKLRAAVKQ
ncbi:16S rRNA (cytosine(1402)-N(4))-methyltransferase RsmH [Patescibacteria group bacterium]|nr:16S rRNA (cytosine(1402)-N(4))-methyltransferase RsmH [Patescibacteria group bacterium]